ncbi:AraC family transcriptional regulator [Proteiniphilum acetatigenes]|uniref:AraC family transcriptional regulator n=1 Tax=Proteiniphilum acetatigenes TaxID=294710 RepID=UPI000378DC29|nr:AraC family transcriptional regulator [Proteiniphilum acetatigenes]SFL47742.1 Helix-turn-helix domain-containing protein [Porphyromonadaceae bacterium KH3CP3RA]
MRNTTENIYNQKVNQVIDYISANLHTPLQLNLIADKINVSQRQLVRIMRSALNESLHSYIARQRIERAVLFMQIEEMTLKELSAMVGYDNPQSFSKAFRKQMGISPKTYIKSLQSRLESYVQSSGNNNNLQSKIINFEGLELVYIRIFGKYGEEEPYEMAWNKLIEFLKENQALTPDTRFVGLSFDDPNVTDPNQCRFYACASVEKKIMPTGEFGTILLRKGKYAVYRLTGSYSGLQELYNNISVNFEYTIRYGMTFEEYITCSTENSKEQITKVYIPIK